MFLTQIVRMYFKANYGFAFLNIQLIGYNINSLTGVGDVIKWLLLCPCNVVLVVQNYIHFIVPEISLFLRPDYYILFCDHKSWIPKSCVLITIICSPIFSRAPL